MGFHDSSPPGISRRFGDDERNSRCLHCKLATVLRAAGHKVAETREAGGTAAAGLIDRGAGAGAITRLPLGSERMAIYRQRWAYAR
jgi:hypothetical protein